MLSSCSEAREHETMDTEQLTRRSPKRLRAPVIIARLDELYDGGVVELD